MFLLVFFNQCTGIALSFSYVVSYYSANVVTATKWKDSSTGQHVEYDQRPDMFR